MISPCHIDIAKLAVLSNFALSILPVRPVRLTALKYKGRWRLISQAAENPSSYRRTRAKRLAQPGTRRALRMKSDAATNLISALTSGTNAAPKSPLSFEGQTRETKEGTQMKPRKIQKPTRAALNAAAREMRPSAGLDLKTWNGRNVTAAEWELIERRETNKPKLGIKI